MGQSLTQLSQGWPQHINSVSVAAGKIILDNNQHIAIENLDEAVALGGEYMKEYYSGRLAAAMQPLWIYKELAIAAQSNGEILTYDELRPFAINVPFEDFLDNALHAGLLTEINQLPYHYRIPTPSFGDCLRGLSVRSPQYIQTTPRQSLQTAHWAKSCLSDRC